MEKILFITSGRGPAECMWVVPRLLKEVLKDAEKKGVKTELINKVDGDQPHTLVSCTILVKGEKVNALVDQWQGSILWIGQSPYRKYHKRKNWFVEVQIAELVKSRTLEASEIEFSTTRASGPGGQHVNKTETAVRAVHRPTGLSVLAQDSRSQLQNKKLAAERLNQLFAQHQTGDIQEKMSDEWKNKITVQRGNPVKTFEGVKFRLVK